jgi:hypothetical protein
MSASHKLNALRARYDAQRIEAIAELDDMFHSATPVSIDSMDVQMIKLTDAINKLNVLNKVFSVASDTNGANETPPQ